MMGSHRQNMNIVQTTEMTKYFSFLPNMSDHCFFTNDSVSFTLVCPQLQIKFIEILITELLCFLTAPNLE